MQNRQPSHAAYRTWLRAAIALLLMLSACSVTAPVSPSAGSPTGPPASASASPIQTDQPAEPTIAPPPAIAVGQLQLTCGSPVRFAPSALSGPVGVESAPHPAAEALRRFLAIDAIIPDRNGWILVALTADEALFLLPARPAEGSAFWNVELNRPDDGPWRWARSGNCDPEPIFDGVGAAWWEIVDDSQVTEGTTSFDVMVHEIACASGRTADARIVPAAAIYLPDRVVIIIGVTPLDGAQTCQEAPATRYTITLAETLGHRALMDGSVFPPELRVAAP